MNRKPENGLYCIDDDFRILYLNDTAKNMYPEIETGQYCYSAFACRTNMCTSCPLLSDGKQNTVYNPNRQVWVRSQAAEADLPGIGECYAITFNTVPELDAEELRGNELLEEQNRLLQKQNRFMEFINDGMPGGYHRCAVTEGYPIVYASDKFLNMIGFTRSELHERFNDRFAALVHPDDSAYLAEACKKAINDENGAELSFHYRILTKNGYMQVVDTTRASEYDGEKFLQCIIVSIADEEKAKENAESLVHLKESLREALMREQEYRQQFNELHSEVLNLISCGVFAYTLPDHELLVVNNAAKRMIGCAPEADPIEEIAAFLRERVITEDKERVYSAQHKLRMPGDIIVNNYKANINGEILSIHSNIKLLEKPDGQHYVLVTMLDTTELENRNSQLNNVLAMQTQMADSLGSGIFAYTVPQHKVLILNQEAKRMFDCLGSDPENYGSDIVGSIAPEDRDAVREATSKLKEPGDTTEYFFHSDSESNGRLLFKCSTKLMSFEDGQKYILSSISDITEQEMAEKRIDEERRQYRNALAYGCESIFTLDLTENNITQPIISADGTDLVRKLGLQLPSDYDTLAGIWFSDQRVVSENKDISAIRSREKLINYYRSGTAILDMEYRIIDTNEYYHMLVLLYEIDEHIKASFVIYDITSRRQGEKLRTAVINSLGQIYSSLFHYSLASGRFTVLKADDDISADMHDGMSYDDFRRVYLDEYVLPEFRDMIAERLDPGNIPLLLADRHNLITEYKRKNSGWYSANLVAAERDENGTVTAVVFAGYVIEQQKQAELAQQEALKAAYESANLANAAKTNFLTAMSHDIRTPMNAIIGMTAIAVTHINDKERVADCLSKISVSSKHLLGLINEVLDMSKIESGKMDLQDEEFNLPELIDNLIAMSKPEIASKGHDFTVSIRNIEHEDVIGDSQRIQQVFMNLMSNAVKYTPDGGKIRLSISEKPTNKQNLGCYEFIFQDNGIGISEDFMDHIFEPFARSINDVRVDKEQGTGLGMPITRNIVQMMNGDITVESKLNEGTKFTVTIYLKLRNENENSDCGRFADLPILVADDDEDSGIYTCEMLAEIGMKGEYVLTGQEAVDRIAERHEKNSDFFAVILDWKMPGMDGVETTREIRRRIGKDVPVIIISSYDWSDIELEARAAGANAFISKPLFKSRMIHLFNELVGAGDEEENSSSEQESFAQEDFGGKRVLLVEDIEINAEIAGEILRMLGLDVEFAVNGKEALDIMTTIPDDYFSAVFMDIQMPVMNGYEAARAIRSLPREYTKYVPIIAMTANAFAEDVAAAKNVGMNEHIAKPIELRQLVEVLRKWLR